MLSKHELERYDRQMIIDGFGKEGQEKLKKARVVIVGAGGLGSPIALYLAAAGVGTIRIIDSGTVERANLNRQILHWEKDIGRKKSVSAREKLEQLNPDIKVETLDERVTETNAAKLISGFDGVVDALDNMEARYIINKAAIDKRIPFFHGAVYGFEGRAMTVIPGKSACLRCVCKRTLPPEKIPVIGVTPAVIGVIEANEVIKYITGFGELLTDRLLVYEGLLSKFTELEIARDPECDHCGHLKE